jgi:outer membrane protein OmpA-like peptidoglycan-associated protein
MRYLLILGTAAGMSIATLRAQSRGGQAVSPPPERIDLLTFAQGAIPVSIGGAGAKLGADFEAAVRSADGDPTPFVIVDGAPAYADTEFVYQLPALTTFDRFAVPNVTETPSPSQTFTKTVEVHGSSTSASSGFTLLASAVLETHKTRGLVTDLKVVAKPGVRWVKVRLVGGIDVMRPTSSFQFSEIVGNGTQATPELATHFQGTWRTGANRLRLTQRGPVVSGCYDTSGVLNGTVTGNILRATGISRSDNRPSAFVLSVSADGAIRGVRSSNNSPFRLYTVATAGAGDGPECPAPPSPALGCGSVIHGINFGFDSAEIRPESNAVLAELFNGLNADPSSKVLIEGHTSSEGTDQYNLQLSDRRARAVVADLVKRGLATQRLTAVGLGESRPIATNNDESGRTLNRRVEVKCQA